ncbi:HD-GYP domain-containing protein [Kitasatospora sp. NPDC048365]|uniref:HD-GYP domain-containing protein n=1 Tax=Kitasatospora sp. NPDC048365 TaxID=3364050 RepID=UPI00371AC21D
MRRVRPTAAGAVRGAAALLLCAAAVHLAADGLVEPEVALAFGGLVALGECVRVTLPGDREQAPIGTAAALAYALLGPLRGLPTAHGVLQVVVVAGAGTLVGATLAGAGRLLRRRAERAGRAGRKRRWGSAPAPTAGPGGGAVRADVSAGAQRVLVVGFAAVVFQPLYNGGVLDRLVGAGPGYWVVPAGVAALAALADAALAAVLERERTGLRFGAALDDRLRSLLSIGSAIVATGLLLSLLAGEVGLWALPLFCVPLLLAQTSFRRAAAVRATTGQTIGTLARATEVAGYTTPGHARRVADTACALGRELGLGSRDLALLEYAALMHDIGQLSLVEPVPGGATALLPDPEQQRIARLGSEVIRRTGVPHQVWQQVARLADPCRLPDGRPDTTLPLAARIIRVANAHDDLVTAARGRGVPEPAGGLEALERLRLERGRSYDPAVLDALARVGSRVRGAD